jgi:hypothetical protein
MGLAHRWWVLLACLDKIKSKSMLIDLYSDLKNQTFISWHQCLFAQCIQSPISCYNLLTQLRTAYSLAVIITYHSSHTT